MAIAREHPVTYVVPGGAFPQGPYKKTTPSEVYLAAGLARRLRQRMKGDSVRYWASKAELSPQTLINILNGKAWPDILTIARLEKTLGGRSLWGSEHRKTPNWTDGNFCTPPGFRIPSAREIHKMLRGTDPEKARKLASEYARAKAVQRQQAAKPSTS
ncbi:MAG: helix-turn-helix transcriptional regulator [bacterium]|nr:helix-turn-helix transcriptional regulator [bacterium]